MKIFHFLLNYYQYRNGNFGTYLGHSRVFFRILSDSFATLFFLLQINNLKNMEKSIYFIVNPKKYNLDISYNGVLEIF